jgi:hypothetical protein
MTFEPASIHIQKEDIITSKTRPIFKTTIAHDLEGLKEYVEEVKYVDEDLKTLKKETKLSIKVQKYKGIEFAVVWKNGERIKILSCPDCGEEGFLVSWTPFKYVIRHSNRRCNFGWGSEHYAVLDDIYRMVRR